MKRLVYPLLIAVCAGLVACATSQTQAPVEDRSVSAASVQAAPTGPGYYTVKKGDTLYRISRESRQKVSDLIAWNSLADANKIEEGQVLRVAPPGADSAVVQTTSVSDTGRDVQPISTSQAQPTEPGSAIPASSESAAPVAAAAAPAPASASASSSDTGGIVWGWPASGKVIRGFTEGQTKGIDIEGKKGENVLAAADGRVIYAGTMSGYGNLVIVKHSEELLSAYAYNDKNLVTQGSAVTRGQPVAEMGNSGTDTVKLHFEVRRQGRPVDPLGYLPKR